MTKEESYEGTQKITTHYEKKPRTEYEGTARGDDRKAGESRVEQNQRKRAESKSRVSSRPDSWDSQKKEKARKTSVNDDIERKRQKIEDKQFVDEFAAKTKKEEAAERKKEAKAERLERRTEQLDYEDARFARAQRRKQPSGTNPFAALVGGQMPSWMGGGGGLPPSMKWGNSPVPPALRMGGSGKPPAWMMGFPGAAQSGKRKSSGNGLPPWFRY